MSRHHLPGAPVQESAFSLTGEERRLLDLTISRLAARRTTFTEEEALSELWDAEYEVSPQMDTRFVLAMEAQGKRPRHWRLDTHTLANNILLDALQAGEWDGRDVNGFLERLDQELDGHFVYCPVDPRIRQRNGRLFAEKEKVVELTAATRAALNELLPRLLTFLETDGSAPRTSQELALSLRQLGWNGPEREDFLVVRTWLEERSDFVRVGQNYWLPSTAIPAPPEKVKVAVAPLNNPSEAESARSVDATHASGPRPYETSVGGGPAFRVRDHDSGAQYSSDGALLQRERADLPLQETQAPAETDVAQRWVHTLRTANLTHGFIPVPAGQRGAYPPRTSGNERHTALIGIWHDDGASLWLWLDRDRHRLYGPALLEQLSWLDAGQRVAVTWLPGAIDIRLLDVNEQVRSEESRLADRDTLAQIRASVGESYRSSLQAILAAYTEGLTFTEILVAIRTRQRHEVHRGTVRAVLRAGGFEFREGRWHTASDVPTASRRFRAELLDAQAMAASEPVQGVGLMARLLARVRVIREGLT